MEKKISTRRISTWGKKSKYMYVKLCAVYSQMGIRVRLNNTKIIKAEFKSDLSIYIK